MALETLKGLKKLGDFNVVRMDELRNEFPEKFNVAGGMDYTWFEKEIRPTNFIYVRHDVNSIAFTLQRGPVKEVGVNGCQVDQLIQAAAAVIHGLNEKFPCAENAKVLYNLNQALCHLEQRTRDRQARAVEGTNQI